MHTNVAILPHPAALRAGARVPVKAALADFARQVALFAGVLAGGAVFVALVLLFVVVAAPLAGGLLVWLVWRSGEDAATAARRLKLRAQARTRRRARALGLRVVR